MILKLIVVMLLLLEMRIFVHLILINVESMKEIVIPTMNVKQALSVILLIVVQHILDLPLMQTAAMLDVSIIENTCNP